MAFPNLAKMFTAFTIAVLVIPVRASSMGGGDILGTWQLTKVLDYAAVAAMDDDQAAKLVGKTLEVRPGGIVFAGEPCQNVGLMRQRVDTVRYVRENYHAAVTHLGLPDSVDVVHLTCTEAFVKTRDKIVVFWDGYFFDAVRKTAGKR